MLGITTPDAIALGTLIIAVLAAWRGATQGTVARAKGSPVQTVSVAGTAIADTAAMQALTQAVIGLTEAVRAATSARIEEDRREQAEDMIRRVIQEISGKPPR